MINRLFACGPFAGPHPNDRSLNHSSLNNRLMQLLSSASAALQKSDPKLSLETSRRTFGALLPSIPCTTARHNLATSFTRALSEPNPIATQHHNAIKSAWTCVQTCFASDPQCQTAKEQSRRSLRSSSLALNFSSFSRGQETAQETGGAERDRTDDLLLAKQALSQLSYGPINGPCPHRLRARARKVGGPGKI